MTGMKSGCSTPIQGSLIYNKVADVILAFPEIKSDIAKLCVIDENVPACATSFSGYNGISSDGPVRRTYAEVLEGCENNDPLRTCTSLAFVLAEMLATATSSVRKANNIIESVDVTFNSGLFYPQPTRSPAGPNMPGNVQFNTCFDNSLADSDDDDSTTHFMHMRPLCMKPDMLWVFRMSAMWVS